MLPDQFYSLTPGEFLELVEAHNAAEKRREDGQLQLLSLLVAHVVAPHVKHPKSPSHYYDQWVGKNKRPRTKQEMIKDFDKVWDKVIALQKRKGAKNPIIGRA